MEEIKVEQDLAELAEFRLAQLDAARKKIDRLVEQLEAAEAEVERLKDDSYFCEQCGFEETTTGYHERWWQCGNCTNESHTKTSTIIARLREALAWYGDIKNYCFQGKDGHDFPPINKDEGKRAREALGK
jgi:ribosomal protein L37AE/L43A